MKIPLNRASRRPSPAPGREGFTLIELLIATSIFSIGLIGFIQSFHFIARAVHTTRCRTLATNIAQEKIEFLKNYSYYALQVTSITAVNNNFSPALTYSAGAYGAEGVNVGGINYIIAARVDFAAVVNGTVTPLAHTEADPGMKQITVHVLWKDGPNWKKFSLSNLLENPNVAPQNASLTGTVKDNATNVVIPGAVVKTIENPALQGITNESGVYSFSVNAGTYTLQCSSSAFYFAVSNSFPISGGQTKTQDFRLLRIATGTITSQVWTRPTSYLVTQVVSSTITWIPDLGDVRDVEYVELFNPTTSTINLDYLYLYPYRSPSNESAYVYGYSMFDSGFLAMVSTYIPPQSYYLLANTSMSFVLFGSTLTADAWYASQSYYENWNYVNPAPLFPDLIKDGNDSSDGQVIQVYASNWTTGWWGYDYVGFANAHNNPPWYKTDYPRCKSGIQEGEQLVRFSTPAATSDQYGRAYDTENNRLDFDCNRYPGARPMTKRAYNIASGSKTVISGVPAYGAMVSVNDTFSGSVIASMVYVTTGSGGLQYPAAQFVLNDVSTGTWNVDVALGNLYTVISTVVVSVAVPDVLIPSSTTVPTGEGSFLLESTGTYGYVSGYVWSVLGQPMNGIQVLAGGVPKTTNIQGYYYAAVATGPVTVIFNPNNAYAGYTSDTVNVNVEQGMVTNVNDVLSRGGTVKGYVTSGLSALPNINAIALRDGRQMGDATTDISGYFYIYNLATGAYTVQLALDPASASSPQSYSVTATTATVSVGTFTVVGAYGTLKGSVAKGTAKVTTGALVIASTATIPTSPPTITAITAPAQAVYYSVSSMSDGTYELLVRGATSYSYNVRAWYPRISGNAIVTDTVSYTGLSVTPGGSRTQNITFP